MSVQSQRGDLASRTVLVVDDNEPTRALIGRVLAQELGVSVELAGDGDYAMRLADERRYDVILLDLLMPGTSGFDVLQRLRTASRLNRATPVIVVSVLGDEASVRRCQALGATFHVVKPIMRESLARVVAEHLRTDSTAGVPAGDSPASPPAA